MLQLHGSYSNLTEFKTQNSASDVSSQGWLKNKNNFQLFTKFQKGGGGKEVRRHVCPKCVAWYKQFNTIWI